jgi:nucleoid-associated protein YgaU
MLKSRLLVRIVLASLVVLLLAAPAVAFAAPSEGIAAAPAAMSSSAPSAWGLCWYRVHWGDTLANIAWHHYTNIWYLTSINHIHNPDRIYAGQMLRVPCDRR